MEKEKKELEIGQKIHFRSWKKLREKAFQLSSEGYGVSVIGFDDMSDNVLTVTAVPSGESLEVGKPKQQIQQDEQLEGQMPFDDWDVDIMNI